MISTEHVTGTTPFTVRRRVKWGDCDPAKVVYTVSFSEYVISVAELFYGHLFGGSPQATKDRFGFGTPTRALAFDFRGSLRPDDEFDMTVWVRDIRSRTYCLAIEASMPDGADVFDALLTPICIPRGERRGIEIPQVLRDALRSYQERCGAAGAAPRRAGQPN